MRHFSKVISILTVSAIMASAASFNINATDVAEPTVAPVTAEEDASIVMSEGITAQNASIDMCASETQVAKFAVPDDMGLPFGEGLLLTTGDSSKVFANSTASKSLGGSGDADLTAIYQSLGFTGTTNDAVKLSFDLVPTAAILMVLLAGVAVAYYARRKNEM